MEQRAPTDPPFDGSTLCTACGLCCSGLYAKIRIEPGERPLAHRAAAPVLEEEDGLYAALPCSFLHGSVCTVYAERYAKCRTFACKLLRGFLAGTTDLATAHARVAEMRRRAEAVHAAAVAAGSPSADAAFHARTARWRALPDRPAREAMARVQLTLATYHLYANTYFRNVPDPGALG